MATKPLPRWVLVRYKQLWDTFKTKEFNFEDAKKTIGDDAQIVSLALSEMRRKGWLEVALDKDNTRKRVYKVKALEEYIKMVEKQIREIK